MVSFLKTQNIFKGISSLVASIDSIMSNKNEQHQHHQASGVNTLAPSVIEYHPDNVSVGDDDAASLRSDLSSDSDQCKFILS